MFLLAACCPSFEETKVVEDGASAEMVDQVKDALAQFAAAVDVDGVCVDTIRFEELGSDGEKDVGGLYDGATIRLDPGAEPYGDTIHELCHAWDHSNDRPSWDHPDLFDPGTVEESAYDTEEKRISEAFARACATRLTATYTLPCDEDLDQRAWLVDNVFPNLGASDVQAGDTTMERLSLPVSDGYVAAAVAVGDQLALAYFDSADSSYHVRFTTPGDWSTSVDVALPGSSQDYPQLVGGDEAVWVWTQQERGVLRRIDTAGVLTEFDAPAELRQSYVLTGYAHGDDVWLSGAGGAAVTIRWSATTGEVQGMGLDADEQVASVAGTPDGVTVHGLQTVYSWSFADEAWSETPIPTDLSLGAWAPLAGGGFLSLVYGQADAAGFVPVRGPDPWIVTSTCEDTYSTGSTVLRLGDRAAIVDLTTQSLALQDF